MASNNVSLGELIHQVGERNKGLLSTEPLGVSIDKEFMPSVANTIGTDLSKYMLLRRNRFACNPMHVGRDRALPIARYKNDAPGIVSPAYMTFEADESKIDLDYLELFFKLAVFDKECWFYTDSTVRGGLSWDALCSIELNLPSFDDQRKIASIVKVIRERMVRLAEQNDYLEELGQALLGEYLSSCDDVCPLGSIMDFGNGFAFKSDTYTNDGRYKILTIKNVQDGNVDCSNSNRIDVLPQKMKDFCKLKLGDVVLSLTGNVGRVGIVSEEDCLLNQRVAVLQPNQSFLLPGLYFFFRQRAFQNEMIGIAKGTAQANLSPVETLRLDIPYNEHDFSDLSKTLTPIFDSILANKIESLRLAELRDILLPKLMSGEIDVSKVDLTQLNNHLA